MTPDRKYFLSCAESEIELVDLISGQRRRIDIPFCESISTIKISKCGKRALFAGEGSGFGLLVLGDNPQVTNLKSTAYKGDVFDISQDNKTIILATENGGLRVWRMSEDNNYKLFKPLTSKGVIECLDLSPDSSFACFTIKKGDRENLGVLDFQTGEICYHEIKCNDICSLKISDDCRSVILIGYNGMVFRKVLGTKEVIFKNFSSCELLKSSPNCNFVTNGRSVEDLVNKRSILLKAKDEENHPANEMSGSFGFTRDSQFVYVVSGETCRLFEVSSGVEKGSIPLKKSSEFFDVSNDGRHFVVQGKNDSFQVWDLFPNLGDIDPSSRTTNGCERNSDRQAKFGRLDILEIGALSKEPSVARFSGGIDSGLREREGRLPDAK
jgi:WD40 repeat protein